MEKVIELLNRMQADGVIENFAIGGGIAAIYYLEPYNTDDVDVFISPVVVSHDIIRRHGLTGKWKEFAVRYNWEQE
jgi:hypothetical protein